MNHFNEILMAIRFFIKDISFVNGTLVVSCLESIDMALRFFRFFSLRNFNLTLCCLKLKVIKNFVYKRKTPQIPNQIKQII